MTPPVVRSRYHLVGAWPDSSPRLRSSTGKGGEGACPGPPSRSLPRTAFYVDLGSPLSGPGCVIRSQAASSSNCTYLTLSFSSVK